MADVIAIPRVGSKTGRNQFVSATMDITTEAAGVALVNLNAVQLTKSQRGLIGFTATRNTANDKISVALNGANGSELSRVVYVVFEKQNDGSLVQLDSQVVSEAGDSNTFPADLKGSEKSVVVYSYGITDKDGAASVKFGNLVAPTAEQVAKLLTTSSDTLSGVSLTKTNGATMNEGTNSANSDDAEVNPPVATMIMSARANQYVWDENLSNQPGAITVTGTARANSGEKVAMVEVTNKPTAGQSIDFTAVFGASPITDGAFTFSTGVTAGERGWLVAGTQADSNSPFIVKFAWPYYYEAAEG